MEGKSLTQEITTMTNGTITPPQTDCEIFSDLVGTSNANLTSKNLHKKPKQVDYLRTDFGAAYEEPASSSSSETSSLADCTDENDESTDEAA